MLKQIRDTGSLPAHAFVIYYDEFLVKQRYIMKEINILKEMLVVGVLV